MPEKELQVAKQEVREKPINRLESFIEKMSIELHREGIPVNKKGRLDPDQFVDTYSRNTIEADKQLVQDLREKWERSAVAGSKMSWIMTREQILRQRTVGEALEMLSVAILHKILGNDFIVVRTSEYDDDKNGVDSLIIERKSGNVVCVFDEVGTASGPIFEAKKRKVLEKNRDHGGADVFYGISFKEGHGGRRLKKGEIRYIPLFYFASSEDIVRKGLAAFSPDGISLEEKKIFKYFIDHFDEQIQAMRNFSMHPKFRESLQHFEDIMTRFKNVV